jgi:tetratricopeptide (TPR) repeat protein
MITIVLLASLAGTSVAPQRWELLLAQAEELALQNRHTEAGKEYSLALVEAEKSGRKELPVAVVLDHNAFHLQQLGQLREASQMYSRALDIFTRKAPDSGALTEVVIGLSSVYLQSGEISKAQSLIQRFLKKDAAHLPQDTAMLLANLGSALAAQGDLRQAELKFEEVLALLEKDGTEQILMVKTLDNLASIDCVTGRISDAREYSQRARRLLSGIKNPPPDLVIKTLANAGGIAMLDRKWEESQHFYSQALTLCEETFGPDHYLLAPILQGYSQALFHLNHKSEAKRTKKRAEAILNRFQRENMLGLSVDAHTLSESRMKDGSLWLR